SNSAILSAPVLPTLPSPRRPALSGIAGSWKELGNPCIAASPLGTWPWMLRPLDGAALSAFHPSERPLVIWQHQPKTPVSFQSRAARDRYSAAPDQKPAR